VSMQFEAAVVTKKREGESFNTDSVNINGKILDRAIIQNGYKGAGLIDGSAYFCLASSFIKDCSDATIVSFDECAADFATEGSNPVSVINDYFRKTVAALNSLEHLSKEISIGAFYGSKRNVVIGRTGEILLYSYRNGVLCKITPENSMHDDGKSNYGCYTFRDVSVDDIYLMLSPGVASVLSEKDIADVCRLSEGSVKKIINIIQRVAEKNPAKGGIGAYAIKVVKSEIDVDDEISGFIVDADSKEDEADFTTENKSEDNAPALPTEPVTVVCGFKPELAIESEENDDSDSETESIILTEEPVVVEPEKKKKGGKVIIVILALLIIGLVLFGVAKFTDFFNGFTGDEPTVDNITYGDTTIEESTTEIESTTEEESTTEDESTTVETEEESTTRRRSSTTTTTTTTERSTSATTTRRSETTTQSERTTAEEPTSEEPGTTPTETEAPSSESPTTSDEPSSEQNQTESQQIVTESSAEE